MRCKRLERGGLTIALVAALFLPASDAAQAQSTAIPWYGVSGGFGVPVSATTRVVSASGESAVGATSGGNVVLLGFLAGTPYLPAATGVGGELDSPRYFAAYQNSPNPFRGSTVIRYDLPSRTEVELRVYNILGQEVARLVDEEQNAGRHMVTWDGRNDRGERLANGVYFYRLSGRDLPESSGRGAVETKKLLLLR